MDDGEAEGERMPVTLRVAFAILITVTVLVFFLSLVVASFLWYWGGEWRQLLSVLPFVPVVVYTTITVLVARRTSWARYATLLFPLPLALYVPAATATTWEFPVGLAALALTTAAVVLIFLPSSRPHFGSGMPQSSGWKPISQRMP
ncbi:MULTISPECIES: hypothetical protein [unclassified Microbacterium]|uniref:hypothetical protein n=1 Tax=unclassified Microbacterium TaxID=2609290 RepID=UPI0016054CEF|nr:MULTISPECIES: hypothetical protein [unclassified Microbacterium]QNA93372.1 hypothetical protein G4G29_15555 [Microbacterium sp. Se63.02b]QYM63597.1 hypothetical protein K1X59_15595 [Microbacterium sp. Se5.02b]